MEYNEYIFREHHELYLLLCFVYSDYNIFHKHNYQLRKMFQILTQTKNYRYFSEFPLYGWVHTCNVTVYRNTVSWQCGRDSLPHNVSKAGYALMLRACSVRCRYLTIASKGWYGYGLSKSGRATWHVIITALSSFSIKRNVYKCTKPLLVAKTSLRLPQQTGNPKV
jgi:hypothetical protein